MKDSDAGPGLHFETVFGKWQLPGLRFSDAVFTDAFFGSVYQAFGLNELRWLFCSSPPQVFGVPQFLSHSFLGIPPFLMFPHF